MARNFKNLKIFHLSYSFLLEIYDILPQLPDTEQRNMFSQLQRAGTSIVLNIVEGASNTSNKVFFNHLQYSYGSCREVEVLLMLAYDLHYIDKSLFSALSDQLEELKASLFRFMQSVDKEIVKKIPNYTFQ
jgi:four helix bundle protein